MVGGYLKRGINQDWAPRSNNARRQWLIIAASSLLLLLVVVIAVAAGVSNRHKNQKDGSDTPAGDLGVGSKSVETACNTTSFPDVCREELLKNPKSSSAKPRELVSIAVQIALEHVKESYYLATNLSTQGGGKTESFAVANCVELMDGAKDYLNQSLVQLSDLSWTKLSEELYDVLVWISAAGSYKEACTEGFNDVPKAQAGPRSDAMRKNQEKLSKVIIVAMGLVNTLSKLGTDLSSWHDSASKVHSRRRMLSMKEVSSQVDEEGYPTWLKAGDRKLLQAPTASEVGADAVVSKDGSGNYESVQAAVDKIPSGRTTRWVIYIKAGVYNENVTLSKSHKDVTFLGDGIGKTIITGNRNVALQGYTTYNTATVAIGGPGFIAKDVTFQNTAGAIGHQAVALRASADYMVFHTCSFEGYQDTLYAHANRQFYRDCDIYGTVDYIFGNAIAVFQECNLLARKPLDKQKNTYTAQGRMDISDPSGYSFQDCSIVAASDLASSNSTTYTYYGRPWRAYSRTVFLGCFIDKLLHPTGWLPWDATNPYTTTLYYGEYMNTGPGSNITSRVKWEGVHSNMTSSEASIFAVSKFLAPITWLESSGVTYDPDIPA